MTLQTSKTPSASRHGKRARDRWKKKTWQLSLVIAGLVLVLGTAAWLVSRTRPAASGLPAVQMPKQRVVRGDPMPEVAWPDLQGNLVRVSDYTGRPVLINTWATWCPPCKSEMPLLDRFYQQYKDQGLVVLAVNGSEEPDKVSKFIQESKFSFPVLLDVTGEAISKLGIVNFPTSILVGRDGMVKYIYIGEITEKTLREVIIPLLGL
jgi:thiol-disulfide isomerase/thioredoxin